MVALMARSAVEPAERTGRSAGRTGCSSAAGSQSNRVARS